MITSYVINENEFLTLFRVFASGGSLYSYFVIFGAC